MRLIFTVTFLLLTFQVYGLEQPAIKQLVSELDALRLKEEVPAYALVITDSKRTLYSEVRGVADINTQKPAEQDAWFRIGSITKTFVALSALKAQEQGKLQLDQPLTSIINDPSNVNYVKNPWVESSPLTLAHLLEQTSGLTDMSKAEWDHNVPIPLETALKKFADQHILQWQPGHYFSYSNTNYGLAGFAVEQATGKLFEDYIQQQVFDGLGMKQVAISWTDTVERKLIPGYNRDGKTPIPYWHTIYRPLGEMSLQPQEMAKLLRFFLNNGRPLATPAMIKRMETPSTSLAAKAGLDYGYGLGLYDWFRSGYRFYGHGGDGDGYLAHFAYQRDSGLGYFLVINAFKGNSLASMRALVEQSLIADLPVYNRFPKPYKLSDPKALLGDYQAVSWRFGTKPNKAKLRISYQDEQLYTQFTNYRGEEESAYPLVAVTGQLFRWRNQPEPTMAIVSTPNGVVFSGDDGNYVKLIDKEVKSTAQ